MNKYTVLFFVTIINCSAFQVEMFGGSPARNMVSNETGIPAEWDVDSGKNIKWKAVLGTETYGGPLVTGELVIVGTKNKSL